MQIAPPARDVRGVARAAAQILESVQLSSDPVGIRVGDSSAVLPTPAFKALIQVLELLARGSGIRIVPVADELTTEEAARLLGVSRPHLVHLVEHGEIAFGRSVRVGVFARRIWRCTLKLVKPADGRRESSSTSF